MNLTTKIVALFLIILAFLLMIMSYILVKNEMQVLTDLQDRHGKSISHAISVFCIESLIIEDYPVLQTFLETTGKEDDEIMFLEIIQDDKVIAEYKTKTASDTDYRIFTSDINFSPGFGFEPKKLGKVRIGISNQYTQRVKAARTLEMVIMIIVIFLLLFTIMIFIIKKVVLNPLISISNGAQEISKGDLNLRLSQDSQDEIGKLAMVFNDMVSTIQEYQSDLEHKVEKRTRQLKEAQRDLLDKAMEAGRAQLSAMVLHNIGNAVTPVKINFEILKRKDDKDLLKYLAQCYDDLKGHKSELGHYVTEDERGRQVAAYMGELIRSLESNKAKQEDIHTKIETGLEYVSDILSLQHSYASSNQEAAQETAINSVVSDAVKMQKSAIDSNSIALTVTLEPDLPTLKIQKSKLMQVIVNFVKNSCDAISEHSGSQDNQIEINTYLTEDRIGFSIADTGIGIEKEQQVKIFDFGVSSKGSSGFGLYYCKSFVEANNGTLALQSPGAGKGTTVIMEFINPSES